MKNRNYLALLVSLFAFYIVPAQAIDLPPASLPAQLVANTTLENFYQISPEVFRSGQPDAKQMLELDQRGFRSVLNLRNFHTDNKEALGTTLDLYHVRMDAGLIGDKQIIAALTVLHNAPKPIVIHCWHGSDRTGAVVAMYRMVFENWSRQDAIDEMMQPEFGHHKYIYRSILTYLQTVDIESIRQQVLAAEPPVKSNK